MKKVFFALMLGLAALAVSCTPEYDDTDLKNRMDQIEQDVDNFDAALESLLGRIAAAEKAVEDLQKALADADYVVSVVASEDGKGVVVTFKKADPIFIPLDLDAEEVDGVVIADVKVEGETATFTFTDGSTVEMPLYHEKAFSLNLDATKITVTAGATVKVGYTVTEATEETVVDVLATTAGYVAKVTETEIEITIPDPFVNGEVLVWADNGAGKSSIRKIGFEESSITVEEVAEVPAEGGEVVIKGVSNVEVAAEVVEGADWLTAAPAGKAEFSFSFTAAANEGAARTAKVALKNGETVVYTVTVAQAAASMIEHVWTINVPFGGGADRNMTMDGEWIYVSKSSATEAVIKAISIADNSITKNVNCEGVAGGTHIMSCVGMLPNNDPNINGGNPILIASNLTGSPLKIYVWVNGIDEKPNVVSLDAGTRRLGDKFTIRGSYQKGELWFWDFTRLNNAMCFVAINNGAFGNSGQWLSGRYDIPLTGVDSSTGAVYAHPEAQLNTGLEGVKVVDALFVSTNIADGFFTHANNGTSAYVLSEWTEEKDPKLDHAWGFNFFEHRGKDYIAYVQLINDRTNATLNIIEDINGAADFKGTLEAKEGLVSIQLLEQNGAEAANGHGACAYAEAADGTKYIAAMLSNNIISLYKLN